MFLHFVLIATGLDRRPSGELASTVFPNIYVGNTNHDKASFVWRSLVLQASVKQKVSFESLLQFVGKKAKATTSITKCCQQRMHQDAFLVYGSGADLFLPA